MKESIEKLINRGKNNIKKYGNYILRYRVPRLIFATAVIGSAVLFPPVIPVVVATGAAIAYAEYKKKNPKATIKHYVQSGLKNQRNHILSDIQATDIGQTIMQAKKRIAQKKNGLKDGETLQTVSIPLLQKQVEMMAVNLGAKESLKMPKKVFSENARKANKLDRIRWINSQTSKEK